VLLLVRATDDLTLDAGTVETVGAEAVIRPPTIGLATPEAFERKVKQIGIESRPSTASLDSLDTPSGARHRPAPS
jgi:hypothetical protein